MKTVIHFLITDIYSGAESVAAHIIKNLPSGWDGYYAAPAGSGLEKVSAMGIKTIECNTSDINDIKRVCREYSPDAVHAHDPHMSFNCARAGIPFVAHLHCNCPWLSKLCPNSIALAYVCLRASKVICVSNSIVDSYIFKKILRKKAAVLNNCIDAAEIRSLAAQPCGESYDICFTGRLEEEKDPLEFDRVVADVKKTLPNVSAVMLGDGSLRDETTALIAKLNLGANITLKGFVDNPYKYMMASKLGVLTSVVEGFGLAAAEQLLLGHPFLAYPVGGLTEIVNDRCGKLCRSKKEMCAEAVRLLSDSAYYAAKSSYAPMEAARFADMKSYMESITSWYSALPKV